MKVYGFLATRLKYKRKQNLDETEDIEVVPISRFEVDEKIISGEIK